MFQTIWIARHGNRLDFVHPEWFNTAEYPYDPPLSEDGVIQARQLAQRLQSEKIIHLFASPFLRTVQTANEIAQVLNLSIKLEAGLGEWLNPEWMPRMPERLSPSLLQQRYPSIDLSYQSRVLPQYPESQEQVEERTRKTINKLVEEFTESMILVGHSASVVGTTHGLVVGNPGINTSLCCLVKVVKGLQGWEIELNGDTSHLK